MIGDDMRIIIEYESSWRNSFLDGSNNEPLPKKGRNFIASTASLNAIGKSKAEVYKERIISKDTVMGVLNRLIGDQRKLYQARQSEDYYFRELEDLISYADAPKYISHEVIYLRNIEGSEDKNGYMGMVKANHPIFQSDYSYDFWNILSLSIEQLCEFILDDKKVNEFTIAKPISLDPISILCQLEIISNFKPLTCEGFIKLASEKLSNSFSEYKPLNSKGLQLVLPMYCSALYLQMQRLEEGMNIIMPKSARGGISGISKNGFTPKDMMNAYVTNGKKLSYGSPYIYTDKEDRLDKWLTKANGQLEITLDIDTKRAEELKQLIDNAGVSSFYLGKKGLAYVVDIRLK
ncbi:type I-Fv CRISPR-associated protein Cas5fv [Kingella negevensis]|uniref:Cas5fv helical domain-containing protein n=1 Tax=Kingella negevensis TaxID=1522312 RepID=A0A238HI73_9NEIS|nr:type I-Fv CRISPR-associated protein Cas5fv [Kingella negevensis]MDK4685588.1 type I-Fv CRISPR-associated protein Cas5fv [Kingella negevensis]MDK4706855.1 type I-Fv CRISPR-associated protein Cas5fv [Kingella negevensis]MDK4710436.1 type I-Fv CRISPR-associated protein Cas5fv [Kingella negevensis]SNB82862.1 Uncharacterised protein [Kingella negevensis]